MDKIAQIQEDSCNQKSVQRRLTRQRKIILEELGNYKNHPTADELYQVVRERLPNISLGTVYRNLDFLVQCGQIAMIEGAGSQKRFDALMEFHQHVRCTKCGRIGDVLSPIAVPDINTIDVPGFTITGSRLEFDGLCNECAGQA